MDLKLKDRLPFDRGYERIGQAVCLSLVNEGVKVAFSDINAQKGEALAEIAAREAMPFSKGGCAVSGSQRQCSEGQGPV
jgi:hypothetical protein